MRGKMVAFYHFAMVADQILLQWNLKKKGIQDKGVETK